MAIFDRNTVENTVVIMATIIFFNTIPKLPYIGKYFDQYPYILIGIAILMISFKDKIANTLGR